MDVDSLFLIRLIGSSLKLATGFLLPLVLIPIVLYGLARWRATHAAVPDDQIGLKFALHYFGSIGLQLALFGAVFLLHTILSPATASKNELYRTAFALLAPAALVLGACHAALRRTNDRLAPNVRRLFAGYNLVVTGLVALLALVLGFQVLFAKGHTGMGDSAAAAVIVYCTAWLVIGRRFGRLVLAAPSTPVSADLGPTVAPPPATGGLPALGGGSFPPIDR
ncbi:MAG: hypothetical protein WKG01_08410 [Kofleriaceae bacterium]